MQTLCSQCLHGGQKSAATAGLIYPHTHLAHTAAKSVFSLINTVIESPCTYIYIYIYLLFFLHVLWSCFHSAGTNFHACSGCWMDRQISHIIGNTGLWSISQFVDKTDWTR